MHVALTCLDPRECEVERGGEVKVMKEGVCQVHLLLDHTCYTESRIIAASGV